MRRLSFLVILTFLAFGCEQATEVQEPNSPTNQVLLDDGFEGQVILVAQPTGDFATDIANIGDAIAAAEPGDVIQFGDGVYAVGEAGANHTFFVTTPGITLQGHPRGTTLRGVYLKGGWPIFGFVGAPGRVAILNLTFDGFGNAVWFGEWSVPYGGYRVEGCAFHQGFRALYVMGFSEDVTTVQGNEFINVNLAFLLMGKTLHFRENKIAAPDPASMIYGQPLAVGEVIVDWWTTNISENNVFQENTISGYADGFLFWGDWEGEINRNQVVRDNTFINQRIFAPWDNGSMVWLVGSDVGTVEGILIKENEYRKSEGIAIVSEHATLTQIMENRFSNLRDGPIDPYSGSPGTGVFLDPGSTFNRVIENTFKNVLNPIVDLGTNNIISEKKLSPGASTSVASATDNFAAARSLSVSTAVSARQSEKIRLMRELIPRPQ